MHMEMIQPLAHAQVPEYHCKVSPALLKLAAGFKRSESTQNLKKDIESNETESAQTWSGLPQFLVALLSRSSKTRAGPEQGL